MMEDLIMRWRVELGELKACLYECGDKPDESKYNLLSADALRLAQCIIEALTVKKE